MSSHLRMFGVEMLLILKKPIYGKTVNVNIELVPDRYEQLRGSHEVREMSLSPAWFRVLPVNETFLDSVLPLMSTFANLEKVIIARACISSRGRNRRTVQEQCPLCRAS